MRTPIHRLAGLAWMAPLCACVAAPLQVTAESPAQPVPATRAPVELVSIEILYTVEPGDHLSGIAARYGVPVRQLVEDNEIRDPDRIRMGSEIVVRLEVPDPAVAPDRAGEDTPRRPVARSETTRLLSYARQQLREARYAEARSAAERALVALGAAEDARARSQRAHLEIVAGTAELAQDRETAALHCFARALEADPELRPDPATTSPKVMRFFELARARQAVAAGP